MFRFVILTLVTSILYSSEVSNGLTPKGKAKTLVLTEDLRFGGEEEDDVYLWSGVDVRLSAGPNGHIYVCDTGEDRILAFDAQGQFIRTIAGKGSGPGEYQRLKSFYVLEDGRALGLDTHNDIGRLFWYDDKMKFSKQQKAQGDVAYINISLNGSISSIRAIEFQAETREITLIKGIMDDKFQIVRRTSEVTIPVWDGNRAMDPEYLTNRYSQLMALPFVNKGVTAIDQQNRAYTARGDRYEIHRWHGSFVQPELVIKKMAKPKMRSQEEIDHFIDEQLEKFHEPMPTQFRSMVTRNMIVKAYEKAEIPPTHNPILGLIPMPDGHLLVVTSQEAGTSKLDIFDRKGVFVGEAKVSGNSLLDTQNNPKACFRNGFLYVMEIDEDGTYQAVRYKYAVK